MTKSSNCSSSTIAHRKAGKETSKKQKLDLNTLHVSLEHMIMKYIGY